MAENLRRAEKEVDRRCGIHMDLCGLKLRTGSILPRPAVLRAKPQRDDRGRVIGPAIVSLHARDHDVSDPGTRETCLPGQGRNSIPRGNFGMAQRAECVMLNKGPFILPAMKVLRDIIERMGAHQHKKRAMLRALEIARNFKP
jgi:hypothetical protein